MLKFENGKVVKSDHEWEALALPDLSNVTLEKLEKTIRDGLKSFYTVGLALATIRDNKLYKQRKFQSFERYCQEVWGMSRPYAYETLKASQIVQKLSGIPDIPRLPSSVSQALPLTKLKTTDKQIEAWREVISKYEQPSAKEVKEEVAKHLPRKESEQPQKAKSQNIAITAEGVSDVQVNRDSEAKDEYVLLEVPANRLNRVEVLQMLIGLSDEQFLEAVSSCIRGGDGFSGNH